MNSKDSIIELLECFNIRYSIVEHKAIYTVEDGEKLNLPHAEAIARNLFLCDDKRKNYYLLSLPKSKPLDLKELRKKLNSRRLTFAAESDLTSILRLPKGAVTPFGVFNDDRCVVKVIFDCVFEGRLTAIPLDGNTSTVWLEAGDLFRLIKQHGNDIQWLEV